MKIAVTEEGIRRKIFIREHYVEELQCGVDFITVPVKKGKISRRISKGMGRILENYDAVITQGESLKPYERNNRVQMFDLMPAQVLRKLSNVYGIDLTTDEIGIWVSGDFGSLADRVISYCEHLRFVNLYIAGNEGEAAAEEILERCGLSVVLQRADEDTLPKEGLVIRIGENTEMEITSKQRKLTDVIYDLPEYMSFCDPSTGKQIFELCIARIGANKMLKNKKVKIRGFK